MLGELKEYTEKLRPITTDPEDIKRIEETEAAAKKYARSMTDYINTSNQMVTEGQMMDAGASTYMKNCNDLLANQNAAMREEFDLGDVDLNERLGKVALVNDIIALGNAVQVMNFKAQATRDAKLIQEAAQRLKGVKEITAKLRKITRKDENIKQIEECESAADDYLSAMEEYLKNYLKLDAIRDEMDEAAGQYVTQCETYLEGQQKKLAQRHAGAECEDHPGQ